MLWTGEFAGKAGYATAICMEDALTCHVGAANAMGIPKENALEVLYVACAG